MFNDKKVTSRRCHRQISIAFRIHDRADKEHAREVVKYLLVVADDCVSMYTANECLTGRGSIDHVIHLDSILSDVMSQIEIVDGFHDASSFIQIDRNYNWSIRRLSK